MSIVILIQPTKRKKSKVWQIGQQKLTMPQIRPKFWWFQWSSALEYDQKKKVLGPYENETKEHAAGKLRIDLRLYHTPIYDYTAIFGEY